MTPPHSAPLVETDLTKNPPATLRRWEFAEGPWTFTAASTTAGQPVTGSFGGMLYITQ